jgi:heat shock protein 90kDa beta
VKRLVWEWEQINSNKAIWLREKDDIYDEDYIDFYKSISKQSNPPMNWVHFNTEGEIVFTAILYIPNRAPHDFYNNYNTRKNEIKLYVRRVLIAEQHNDLIPKYFSFVLGVIDSNDISVNVNRETLQQSKSFKVINQRVTKKILDMIGEIAAWEDVTEDEYEEEMEEDSEELALMDEEELAKKREAAKAKLLKERKERYDKFYEEFGKAIKLGILEDKTNRKKLASLSRWYSTRSKDALTSFDDYIKRMKDVQDQIYFFSGEDRAVLEKSPLVVGLARKGYEVLLCDDPIDEYVFNVLREYEGKVLDFLVRTS